MNSINNLKVLCIEDDKFARDEMVHFLKKRVSKVFSAKDGIEGVKEFSLYKPDVVIVDLLMPNMDGIEAIYKIKELAEKDLSDTSSDKINKAPRFIIVTSVGKADIIIQVVNMGVDGYIIKPVDFTELELKLEKIGDSIGLGNRQVSGIFSTINDRRIVEDNIKREIAKIIKTFTGTGPREIIVQLLGNDINVAIFGSLTQLELNLLKNKKNFEMLKHMRAITYESMASLMADVIKKHTGVDVKMSSFSTELRKGVERVGFSAVLKF